jgi:hypothetical protein
VDERFYLERSEPGLAALVPKSVEQRPTNAIPESLARLFGIGDIGLRAFWHLRKSVESAVAQLHPRAVLITGSPYYPMLLTADISRRFGIPVILDFQDPWVSAQGATQPKWSKPGIAHRLAVALEPRAVRHASYITSVSETQNAQMAAKYPWLDSSRMAAIPIGGDPEDFEVLRTSPVADSPVQLDERRINLSYVGTFLPRAAPLVREIFRAVRIIKESRPQLMSRLRLNFVGTSNQPNYVGPSLVSPLAIEFGIADVVAETPQRVPFFDALGILAKSHGLLLIGSDEPHYTASKIYPSLMSGRPYLSLFHSASSAHRILSAAGGGRTFCFSDAAELSTLAPALSKALLEMLTEPASFGRSDPAVYDAYTARSVAGQFAEVFERAAK